MPTSRPKVHLDSQKGFSLLEMLVVLSIMGMILSLIGVRLVTSIESTRFIKTAEAAIADLKSLRLQAMLNEQPILIIDTPKINSSTNTVNTDIRRMECNRK